MPHPTQQREAINFEPNLPVTLSLKYSSGRETSKPGRIIFTTTDNRVFFVDLVVARQIETLNLAPGENITLTKIQRNGRGPITWTAERVFGEQPNGTFSVPAAPRKPMVAASLEDEALSLVNVYAAVLTRSQAQHGGKVKPEEVRALVTAAYLHRVRMAGAA